MDKARRLLAEAGYAGQRVVVINPTDFPLIGPLGQVTADLLKKMGMNVELQESDWGTVVQRRTSREPVDKGGWSIFHTTGSSSGFGELAMADAPSIPLGQFYIRTVFRKNLTGMLQGPCPLPWNLRRV